MWKMLWKKREGKEKTVKTRGKYKERKESYKKRKKRKAKNIKKKNIRRERKRERKREKEKREKENKEKLLPKKVWWLSDLRITFETNNNCLLDFYPGNIQFWVIFCYPSGILFKKWKQNSPKYT